MTKQLRPLRLLFALGIALISTPLVASAQIDLIVKACNPDGSFDCGGACSSLPQGSPCSWCCTTCEVQ